MPRSRTTNSTSERRLPRDESRKPKMKIFVDRHDHLCFFTSSTSSAKRRVARLRLLLDAESPSPRLFETPAGDLLEWDEVAQRAIRPPSMDFTRWTSPSSRPIPLGARGERLAPPRALAVSRTEPPYEPASALTRPNGDGVATTILGLERARPFLAHGVLRHFRVRLDQPRGNGSRRSSRSSRPAGGLEPRPGVSTPTWL